jgi:hypothetical protein
MSTPIILIHKGDSFYLPYTLIQVKTTNPESEIFLIGDSKNSHYKFITHINIDKYFDKAQKFSNLYKHMNSNQYFAELYCFQRWFVLYDFMKTNNLKKCIYIDSDVMLYEDILKEKRFEEFDLSFSGKSPHFSFINNLDALEDFCSFIISLYKDNELLEMLKKEYKEYSSDGRKGGICDMTAIQKYSDKCKHNGFFKIGNVQLLKNSLEIYDHSMNSPDGFEVKNSIKNVYLKEKKPFCKQISSNTEFKFMGLHFQGESKKSIRKYYTGNKTMLNYYIFIYKFKKIVGYLHKSCKMS